MAGAELCSAEEAMAFRPSAKHELTRRVDEASAPLPPASLLCRHAGSNPFSIAKSSTFLACSFAAIIPACNAESVVFIIHFTGGHQPSAGVVDQPTIHFFWRKVTETDDGGGDRLQGKGLRGKRTTWPLRVLRVRGW